MGTPRALPLSLAAAALLCAACSKDPCERSLPSDSGPGDTSNLFPVATGSRWHYATSVSGGASTWIRVEVTGTRQAGGRLATVFSATSLDGSAPPSEALFAAAPGGVLELADPGWPAPLGQLFPLQILSFAPSGTRYQQLACTGLGAGEDLDGDGKAETLDVQSAVALSGPEAVTVPAGSFDALRAETSLAVTLHASGGQSVRIDGTDSSWYAPGVGRVRTRTSLASGSTTELIEQQLLGYVVGSRRGGLTQLATVATGLAPPDSDTESPGRPALSFDGAGHLLVTKLRTSPDWGQDQLQLRLLGTDGATLRTQLLVDRRGYGFRPAAAFNGTAHLVVSNACAGDCGTVLAQRVSKAGDPLDGASGFDLAAHGPTAYAPAVASDGSGWLAAWAGYQTRLQLARVSAAGQVLGTLQLGSAASPSPSTPALAFGGGSYLVAWVEAGTQVVAARVAADGTVLDPTPIAVSTAPGEKAVAGVAFDGVRFLVAWSDTRSGAVGPTGPVAHVYAARVGVDGLLLDGPPHSGGILVNGLEGQSKLSPTVAFAGGRFVLAWWIDGFTTNHPPDWGVLAARVSGAGVLLDGPADGPGRVVAVPTASGSRFVHPVVAPTAQGDALVVWVDNGEASGGAKSMGGAWYAW